MYHIEANQYREEDRRYGPEAATHLPGLINNICFGAPELPVFVLVSDSSAKGGLFDAKSSFFANLQFLSRPSELKASSIRRISSKEHQLVLPPSSSSSSSSSSQRLAFNVSSYFVSPTRTARHVCLARACPHLYRNR